MTPNELLQTKKEVLLEEYKCLTSEILSNQSSQRKMIGSVLCPCRTISRFLAHDMLTAQEHLNYTVVISFLKHLFPPTTPTNGALPHTPITLSALFQGLTIYR